MQQWPRLERDKGSCLDLWALKRRHLQYCHTCFLKSVFLHCAILEYPAGGVVNKTQLPMFSIKPPTSSSGEADPGRAFSGVCFEMCLTFLPSTDSSGWASLWKKYRHCLPSTDSGHYITSDSIMAVLRKLGIKYHVYEFPSGWDITECFIEGDPAGGHMMDFLTGTKNFLGTAPAALRSRLQEALCQPECSSRKDGRVIFCNNLSMIVAES